MLHRALDGSAKETYFIQHGLMLPQHSPYATIIHTRSYYKDHQWSHQVPSTIQCVMVSPFWTHASATVSAQQWFEQRTNAAPQ